MSSSPAAFHTPPETVGQSPYRPAQKLPRELRDQVHIYLEERIYTSALTLLDRCLISGQSTLPRSPAYAPTSVHLSLLNTLLVDPAHTTKSLTEDAIISSKAYILLTNALKILGPVNADFARAFTFSPISRRLQRNSHRRRSDEDSANDSEDELEKLNNVLVEEGSLFGLAESFWDVVGWAFNCSVVHKKRWECWQVWLGFMLDAIEADWKERERLGASVASLEDSILLRYMSLGGRTHTHRRMIKAVFASGDVDSLRAFPEIFPDETQAVHREKDLKRKRTSGPIDFEKDDFGGYSDHSSPAYASTPTDSPIEEPLPTESSSPVDEVGGVASLDLRLRLLSLLSLASFTFPDITLPIPHLYDFLHDSIRPLPVSVYALYLSTSTLRYFLPAMLISLLQLHLSRLIPPSAPASSQENDGLTQKVLERCYLPFAADTTKTEDNAKVAVGVEMLVRCFLGQGCDISDLKKFNAAVEKGILAREKKVAKRKNGAREGLRAMSESGERLRMLVRILEMKTK